MDGISSLYGVKSPAFKAGDAGQKMYPQHKTVDVFAAKEEQNKNGEQRNADS